MSDRRLRVLRPRTRQQIIGKVSSRLESKNRQREVTRRNLENDERNKDSNNEESNTEDDDDDESVEQVNNSRVEARGRAVIGKKKIRGKKLDGKYQCNSCDSKPLFTLRQYMKHIKVVHKQKEKTYECPHCDYVCQHNKKLLRHFRLSHSDLQDKAAVSSAERSRCPLCAHIAANPRDLEAHQRTHHLKRRFFRCSKCSYVTHVRARYTKHIKYHSMPMIKCDSCDFRTPYKWNLDRHLRSHGGVGPYHCGLCDFTADIRQSLTVHETNHHDPPLNQNTQILPKRANQVGASDFIEASAKEYELSNSLGKADVKQRSVTKEVAPVKDRPSTPPKSAPVAPVKTTSSQRKNPPSPVKIMATPVKSPPSPTKLSSPRVILTPTKTISVNSLKNVTVTPIKDTSNSKSSKATSESSKEFTRNSDCISLKCEVKNCTFVTSWNSEMQRHVAEAHGPPSNTGKKPLPMLIPLTPVANAKSNSNSPAKSPSTLLKVPKVRLRPELAQIARVSEIAKLNKEKKEAAPSETFEKKNASFFDKIKEKLTNTNAPDVAINTANELKCWCTFEASTQDELTLHKQTHNTSLSISIGNTRCSKCRRRCKTALDLQVHMRLFHNERYQRYEGRNPRFDPPRSRKNNARGEYTFPMRGDWEQGQSSSGSRPVTGEGNPAASNLRRVFKCPNCPFWASTASRFHVHIVGHLNRKPFECSLCGYRSNWRWDITKHIKLKTARDAAHAAARVLMTDETGRRNYTKYNKYLSQVKPDEGSDFFTDSGNLSDRDDEDEPPPSKVRKTYPSTSSMGHSSGSNSNNSIMSLSSLSAPPPLVKIAPKSNMSLLKNQAAVTEAADEGRKTLWKCKRCNFRDNNKEAVMAHVKTHYGNASPNKSASPLACNDCPFVGEDEQGLEDHRANHKPNLEAIFKCYLCPYYVNTKMELLEHSRLHGEDVAEEHHKEIETVVQRSPISSPSKESTSTSEAPSKSVFLDTRKLPDPPLVWVTRPQGTLQKMFKCRHCPYLSCRHAEVIDHETMHSSSQTQNIKCTQCSFSCSKSEMMVDHRNIHSGSLGTIHCLVDEDRSDEEQVGELANVLNLPERPALSSETIYRDPRLVHCCSRCPARFLCEKELRIHLRYHTTELSFTCPYCSYAARQPAHLVAHQKAHSPEYQERTRYLLSFYGHSQRYPPPLTACIESTDKDPNNRSVAWIVVQPQTPAPTYDNSSTAAASQKPGNQVFTCAKCPARYFRLDALEYHITLHGASNRFTCSECDYSPKTAQNLVKHQVVHRRQPEIAAAQPTSYQPQVVSNVPIKPANKPRLPYLLSGGSMHHPTYAPRPRKPAEKKYKCSKCMAAYEKRDQLSNHLMLHGADNKYSCELCDYSVKYFHNFMQHMNKHHSNDDIEPIESVTEESEVAALQEVEVTATALDRSLQKTNRKYHCEYCDFSASYYAQFVQHMTTKHENYNRLSREEDDIIAADYEASNSSTARSGKSFKRTINSAYNNSSSQGLSNQDKQALLLMQKKGVLTASNGSTPKTLRCNDCPFNTEDKESFDMHKRRHGIGLSVTTESCPHCNYYPRKDEVVQDHIQLHFTRLYKPEAYIIVDKISLKLRKLTSGNQIDKTKEPVVLFKECDDEIFLPAAEAPFTLSSAKPEKVVVDLATGETKHIGA